jgi:hypothetical protein
MPGDDAGGEIFWVGFFYVYTQLLPPLDHVCSGTGTSVTSYSSILLPVSLTLFTW